MITTTVKLKILQVPMSARLRMSRSEEEAAVKVLTNTLNSTSTKRNTLPGYDKNVDQESYQIGLNCDEVYPNIFIGDE